MRKIENGIKIKANIVMNITVPIEFEKEIIQFEELLTFLFVNRIKDEPKSDNGWTFNFKKE